MLNTHQIFGEVSLVVVLGMRISPLAHGSIVRRVVSSRIRVASFEDVLHVLRILCEVVTPIVRLCVMSVTMIVVIIVIVMLFMVVVMVHCSGLRTRE